MIYPFQRSLICGRVSQPVNIKALRKKSIFFFPFSPHQILTPNQQNAIFPALVSSLLNPK